jgi:MFS family permease
MALVGMLAIVTASGSLTIWLLITTVVLASACGIVSEVALQSYLPSIVISEQLTNANARMETSRAVAQISGPGLGGLLIQALGPPAALAWDSLSFVPLITTIARAGERRLAGNERDREHHIIAQVRDGVRFMRADRLLWRLPSAAALGNLGLQLFRISFLLFAYRVLGFSAGQAGLALSFAGAGAVLGSLMTPRAVNRFGQRRVLVRAVLLEPLLLLPMAALSGTGGALQLACVLFFLSGVVGSPWNIISKSLRMVRTPDDMQGRVNAAARTIALTGTALGALFGGLGVTFFTKILSPSSGPQMSMVVGVAVAGIGMVLVRKPELYEPPSWSEIHREKKTASFRGTT